MLLPAIGMVAGLFISEHAGTLPRISLSLWFCVSFACAAIAWTPARSRGRLGELGAVAVFIAALAIGFWRHQAFLHLPPDHVAHAAGGERLLTRLRGTIVTAPTQRASVRRNPYLPLELPVRTSFTLQARAVCTDSEPRPISGLVLVHCTGPLNSAALGDEITITGWIDRPGPSRNPHQPDWSVIQRRNAIHARMNCDGPQFITVSTAEESVFLSWQRRLRATGRSLLLDPHMVASADPAAGLLEAILLGQRSAVSATMDDAFARTGVVHVLSVSGFHIGVLAWACWFALRYLLRCGNRASIVVTLVCVLLYGCLAEPTAPVLRSLLMTACISAALLMRRQAALLNSVCIAAMLTLLVRPADVFSAGFQLSFIQVLALIVLFPPLYQRLVRQPGLPGETALLRDVHTLRALLPRLVGRTIAALGLVSAISWLIAAPLIAFHFQMLAPWAMLHSMLLTPFFMLEIILGVATIVVSALIPPAAWVFQSMLLTGARTLLAAVNAMAGWPATRIPVEAPPVALLIVAYFALGLLLLHRRAAPPSAADGGTFPGWKRLLAAALLCLAPLCAAGWSWPAAEPRNHARLTVLSVGNGTAAWLDLPERRTAVLDFGTMSNFDISGLLVRHLRSRGTRAVDALFISHDDYDHFSGVPALLNEVGIRRLIVNPQMKIAAEREWPVRDLLRRLEAGGVRPEEMHAPAQVSIGEASFQLLWPTMDHSTQVVGNDASLVILAKIHGRRLLFPGDIERRAMRDLVALHNAGNADLRCDVLLAPHHGAISGRETREFYAAAAPRCVIVSTGRERSALVALLRDVLPDARILTTRESGAVVVTIDAQGTLSVTAPYAPPDAQRRHAEEPAAPLSSRVESDGRRFVRAGVRRAAAPRDFAPAE